MFYLMYYKSTNFKLKYHMTFSRPFFTLLASLYASVNPRTYFQLKMDAGEDIR